MKNKKIVYCAGVFDILHVGHIKYLELSKSYGDILVVGVVTDEGVLKYKYKKPTTPFEQRFSIIQSLKMVDYVIRQEDTDPTETLKIIYKEHNYLTPDIMIRSDDYKGEPPGTEFMKSIGGIVIRTPYYKGISATMIKERIVKEYGKLFR